MSRFRSTKRSKELSRKARHQAKEARKRERRERAQSGEVVDDIDWSQAVGLVPPGENFPDEESEVSDGMDWSQAASSLLPENPVDKDGENNSDPER
jgi:hypothetical protein